MAASFAVERIEEMPALEALSPEWWALWHRVPGSTPFQSPGWLIPWWRAFHPGALHVLTLRRNGPLAAVAPLYLEHATSRFLPLGVGVSDDLDILVDPACENEAGKLLVQALAALAAQNVRICFEELGPAAAALRLPFGAQWGRDLQPQSAQPVLSLPGCVDAMHGHVPARKMRDLRVARRRMGADARTITVGPETLEHYLRELFRLHGMLWTSRGQSGVLSPAAVRSFHAQAVPQLMTAGLARLYALVAGDRTVGVYYGLLAHGCACAYLSGFDPAFSHASPGTVLVGHAMEQAIREGATEFNFLRGREKYKYRWGAVDRWSTRLELWRQ